MVFPQPLRDREILNLKFVYSGEVLSEAGGGLLYVGARGTWYPNRGLAMADFDLEFDIPVVGRWSQPGRAPLQTRGSRRRMLPKARSHAG